MEVSAEYINGVYCTVVRRDFVEENGAKHITQQLALGIPVLAEFNGGFGVIVEEEERPAGGSRYYCDHGLSDVSGGVANEVLNIITILPPLPKYPKPKNLPVIYLYMAEGIFPYAIVLDIKSRLPTNGSWAGDGIIDALKRGREMKITACLVMGHDSEEKVEVAIGEKNIHG